MTKDKKGEVGNTAVLSYIGILLAKEFEPQFDDSFPLIIRSRVWKRIKEKQELVDMKRSKRRHTFRALAGILATIILVAATVLLASAEVRAKFITWTRDTFEEYIVFRFLQTNKTEPLERIQVGWIPPGYTLKEKSGETDHHVFVYHEAKTGRDLILLFDRFSADSVISISGFETENTEHFEIRGMLAEYHSDDESESDELTVIDEDEGLMISINGFLTKEEMIAIIESCSW